MRVKIKRKLNQAQLKQLIETLKPYKPLKIVLFGSYVKGNYSKDSDLDLLIIKRTNKPAQHRIGDVLDLLHKKADFGNDESMIAVEPIVYTPEEIKRELALGDFFIEGLLQEGKVIYEQKAKH